MIWDLVQLIEGVAAAVEITERDLRDEQAVYGLDSLDELKLHTVLASGLDKSYSVAREVHYPSSAGNKLTHRKRCDMVLSAAGRPLKLDARPPTLFDPPNQTEPADAFWMEIKIAYQFGQGGVRHGGYSSQWRNAIVSDLQKMEQETAIQSAGLLLVVFTESTEVFAKDVELFEDVLMIKGVLAGFRQSRSVPILDRMGHRYCSAVIWPTIQRGI